LAEAATGRPTAADERLKKYRRNCKKINKKQGNRKNFKLHTVIDILINKRARWYEHVSRKNK